MHVHWSVIIKAIILFIQPSSTSGSNDAQPMWSWSCVDKKCVPSLRNALDTGKSLETCNSICGMQLWPYPTGNVTLSDTTKPIHLDDFHLIVKTAPSALVEEYLHEAFILVRNRLRRIQMKQNVDYTPVTVQVELVGCSEKSGREPLMHVDTDESYYLTLNLLRDQQRSIEVNILAHSFCGARHAFETLSQLITKDHNDTLVILDSAVIEDAPRFSYRGIMLDTARNFFSVTDIMKTIDAMASCKLNTFHWHATDSQAFPLLLSMPQFALRGALGPSAVYSSKDILEVVRYAKLRGVRILMEIEAPAHVGEAWQLEPKAEFEDLVLCLDTEPQVNMCEEPPCGVLNPRNTKVYDLLGLMYSDVRELTEVDDIYHLGGDITSLDCWVNYFKTSDVKTMWLNFTKEVFKQLENANGVIPDMTVIWMSDLSEHLKTDMKEYFRNVVLQIRSPKVTSASELLSGMKVIISHEDTWDLNSGFGKWYDSSLGFRYNSWQRVYEHRPWSAFPASTVLGGEATVWASDLDAGGLDARIWPRGVALAERLWSDRTESATPAVQARLDVHRSRLIARGVKAAPIWSRWCTQNPYTCT